MAQKLKIGDKVQLRKDIPVEELTELLGSYCLVTSSALELQRRGEVTIKGIQHRDLDNDWDDSVLLEEIGYYWPIELFEPVNKPKSKEDQVQEDIQNVKDIIKRYGLSEQSGPAVSLVKWLEDFGQDNLIEM